MIPFIRLLAGDVSRDATKFILKEVNATLKVRALVSCSPTVPASKCVLSGHAISQPRTVHQCSKEGFSF